ncbi:MAG TPA: sn-glycerol-3-phosphate ABC transporter permease UgpE [Desulfobacteraceae bacterium]|nr:sn-glycerol-3-phosphate ABC transporter permease UgpE [Desulfobacteraceae bacterium]
MVQRRPWLTFMTHATLVLGILVVGFPIYIAFVASTHALPDILTAPMPWRMGPDFIENYTRALTAGSTAGGTAPVGTMLFNSLVMAMGIAVGKIAISIIAAFAIVYFDFRFRMFFFWMIFITLMLPVEVRILPTYEVVANLGMLNSYAGLIIPLIASATATFLFRQFFLMVPDELTEAARIDGAGPIRFFIDILFPMSRTNIGALFVILFIYGWNQYLWPLLITTEKDFYTILIGINQMLAVFDNMQEWHIIMATTLLAMIPPVLVVIGMQRLFVKGLTETEK